MPDLTLPDASPSGEPTSPAWGQPPPPLLREGARFRGLVVLRQPTRIDGSVEGEIVARGPLWLGPNSRVRARVEAPEVMVAGRLEGSVAASRIELLGTARVNAELVTARLVLAEGCVVEGRCRQPAGEPSSA